MKIIVIVALINLVCCSTNMGYLQRNLDASSKMSSLIMLDPIPMQRKDIFLQVKNLSTTVDVQELIRNSLQNKGYRIADDPEKASYLLQVNVLQFAKSDKQAVQYALNQGYGTVLADPQNSFDSVTSLIADLQISEKLGNSFAVKQRTTKANPTNSKQYLATETTQWNRYQTRIATIAKLDKPDKQVKALADQFVSAVVEIF